MDSATPDSEHAEEAAARWFARQQSGAWSDSDQAQLEAWLAAATAHRIHYIRVTAAWEQSARMQALGAGVQPGVIPPRGAWGDARFPGARAPVAVELPDSADSSEVNDTVAPQLLHRPMRKRMFLAGAAAALCVATIGAYFLSAGRVTGERYSTPIGGLDDVELADGSRITLNTDTSIRVSLQDNERRINLERGEAFFDVAKDPSRPFAVYAGDKRVVAVGTKFAVRRQDDDVQVVVTEGRVNLAAADAPAPVAAVSTKGQRADLPAPAGSPSTFLDAGAVARTSDSEVLIGPHTLAEAEKLLSWRMGYVSFENLALADAVAEFNRYNTRKILIEDPLVAAIRVGGNFRADNTDAFLDLMQSGFPIAVERHEDKVVLRAR